METDATQLVQYATVVLALNICGSLIKVTPVVPNAYIPHILVSLGSLFACFKYGFGFDVAVDGAGLGMAAVGAHQLVVQTKYAISNGPTPPTPPPAPSV